MQSYTALLALHDKLGSEIFASQLYRRGWKILATEGTAKHIRGHGLALKTVEELTGMPPLFEGRVRTLHPKVFGGILYEPSNVAHKGDLRKINAPLINIVAVNFRPFDEVIKSEESSRDILRAIDVGGVALLHAVSKMCNDERVFPVVDPKDYREIIEVIRERPSPIIPGKLWNDLHRKALKYRLGYENAVATWLLDNELKVK